MRQMLEAPPEIDIRSERAPLPDPAPRAPILVVGDPTARQRLGELIAAHPDVAAGHQTRFLLDIVRVLERQGGALAVYGYPDQYWFQRLARLFAEAETARVAALGKSRWTILAGRGDMELLERLFPSSPVIEVMPWRIPGRRFARRAVRRRFPGRHQQISRDEVMTRPETARRSVLEFLGEQVDTLTR